MFDDGGHDQQQDFGMGGLQTMGIVNAFKTGDLWLDMIIAMLIPVFLRFAFGLMGRIEFPWYVFSNMFQKPERKHERSIAYRFQRNSWGGATSLDADNQNTVLLKAIQLYIHHKVKLNLKSAHLNLTSMEDNLSSPSSNYDGYGYDYGDDGDDEESKTLAGQLSKYKIIKDPPRNVWHDLGSFGTPAASVQLQIDEHEEDVSGKDDTGKAHCITTFRFVSSGATAIDSFVDQAYRWYMDELRSMEDNSRYYYELKSLRQGSDEDESSTILYNRYRLSDEKTFGSLFFRQKDPLLSMVDNFQSKSGKYAIAGFPHKLGVLLHGPPGTGKTSMIKALAQYTGRSIVSVPLTRISTNSELMDMFFQQRYSVAGEYMSIKMKFKDVIFVMEDVDAASKVVRRRDGGGGESVEEPELIDSSSCPKTTWTMLLESNDGDCKDLVKTLIEKSERLKIAALKSDVLKSIARRMSTVSGLGDLSGNGTADLTETVNSTIEAFETVDRFLGAHARSIKAAVESGVQVNDAFVDELLGLSPKVSAWRAIRPTLPSKNSLGIHDEDEASSEKEINMIEAARKMEQSAVAGDTDTKAVAGPSLWTKPKKDELNLQGLLNVMDGIIDTPGRILIMTTNHPEMLDPALIRPGRIDKQILLGYMSGVDAIGMLEHYFQTTLSDSQKERVEVIFDERLNMTPAQVEQMSAENDAVEDMLQQLEDRAGILSSATVSTSSASSFDD